MKELYLHIGTHKTGTTALQRFFAANGSVLREHGICYPLFEYMKHKDHRRLVMSLYADNAAPYCEEISGIKSPTEEWADFLEAEPSTKVLLSSEQFFICSPEIISKIHELTKNYTIKVICYIRRQDELEESWYNQSIKGFRNCSSLPVSTGEYDTRKHFSNWENIFGSENIIVRPYEKRQFYGGSIFSDFLYHVFDVKSIDEFVLPEQDENVRLHRTALEYQRLINCLSLTNEQKNGFNEPMRDVSVELFNKGRDDFSVFSPEDKEHLLKNNEHFYDELARKYHPNGKSFFCDFSVKPYAGWSFYSLTKDDACFINTYLANNHIELFETFLEGMEKGLDSTDPKEKDAAVLLLPGVFSVVISDFVQDRKKLSAIEKSRAWKILCKLKMIKNIFLLKGKDGEPRTL